MTLCISSLRSLFCSLGHPTNTYLIVTRYIWSKIQTMHYLTIPIVIVHRGNGHKYINSFIIAWLFSTYVHSSYFFPKVLYFCNIRSSLTYHSAIWYISLCYQFLKYIHISLVLSHKNKYYISKLMSDFLQRNLVTTRIVTRLYGLF